MVRAPRYNKEIVDFILRTIDRNPVAIARQVSDRFSVSRVTANRYLARMVSDGLLIAFGSTRSRTYRLRAIETATSLVNIDAKSEEDVIYSREIEPLLKGVSPNVREIVQHCATEMINNVIDHSSSPVCRLQVERTAVSLDLIIGDIGVGIFRKITRECGLSDEREAILELAKGKLTTAPERHSGEGIFFSSRMCRSFQIGSYGLWFDHHMDSDGHDFLLEVDRQRLIEGTAVFMTIDLSATHTVTDIFRRFEDQRDGYGADVTPAI